MFKLVVFVDLIEPYHITPEYLFDLVRLLWPSHPCTMSDNVRLDLWSSNSNEMAFYSTLGQVFPTVAWAIIEFSFQYFFSTLWLVTDVHHCHKYQLALAIEATNAKMSHCSPSTDNGGEFCKSHSLMRGWKTFQEQTSIDPRAFRNSLRNLVYTWQLLSEPLLSLHA